MKKVTSYIVKTVIVLVIMAGLDLYGQIPSSPDTPPPPVGLPIDGGLLWLLISGLVLGVFKSAKRRG